MILKILTYVKLLSPAYFIVLGSIYMTFNFLFLPLKDADLNYSLDSKSFTQEYIYKIENNIGMKLPKGSRGVNFSFKQTAMFDNHYVAKIEIPTVSGIDFRKRVEELAKSEKVTCYKNYVEKNLNWWNVTEKTIKAKISYQKEGHIELFLCFEDDKWVLYVLCAFG